MNDKSFGSGQYTSVTAYSQAPGTCMNCPQSQMPLLLTYFTSQITVLNIRQMPMPRHIRLRNGAVVEKCLASIDLSQLWVSLPDLAAGFCSR